MQQLHQKDWKRLFVQVKAWPKKPQPANFKTHDKYYTAFVKYKYVDMPACIDVKPGIVYFCIHVHNKPRPIRLDKNDSSITLFEMLLAGYLYLPETNIP